MRRKSGSMTFLAARQPWLTTTPGYKGYMYPNCSLFFLLEQTAYRNKVPHPFLQGRERFLILRYSKKQHTCLRCKPHSPASALRVVKVMFSFLYCLPLAWFPNQFKTWVEGKVLVIEPPQIPNSRQSPQILPPLPSNVIVSPIESTLGIVWVFLPISTSVTNAWF